MVSGIVSHSNSELTAEDLCVDTVKFDFGLEENNPVDRILFFSKDSPDKAALMLRDSISMILPGYGQPFLEKIARVYCKSQEKVDAARK